MTASIKSAADVVMQRCCVAASPMVVAENIERLFFWAFVGACLAIAVFGAAVPSRTGVAALGPRQQKPRTRAREVGPGMTRTSCPWSLVPNFRYSRRAPLSLNGMMAMARTPVLPEATLLGPLSARLRRPSPRTAMIAIHPLRAFHWRLAGTNGCREAGNANSPAGFGGNF